MPPLLMRDDVMDLNHELEFDGFCKPIQGTLVFKPMTVEKIRG